MNGGDSCSTQGLSALCLFRTTARRTLSSWALATSARVLLAVLLVSAGCAAFSQRSVLKVPLDRPAPPSLSESADTETLLGAVASVLVGRIGLPLSSPLNAYLYSNQEAFELGLVTEARGETWLAKDMARFAWGVGTYYGIFLRQDKLSTAPLFRRVGLIAHELTHVSQYEVAGGRRGTSDQWLREGAAEWVRFRVLEYFQLRSYADSKAEVIQEVRRRGSAEEFPSLTSLVTFREWVTARNQSGQWATYSQAFMAVDLLVERRGSAAVMEYFRRFGRLNDREENFRAAFGQPVSEFAREFRSSLSDLLKSRS